MDRRCAIAILLASGALATNPGAWSQSTAAPRRIGILLLSNPVAVKGYLDAFHDELAKLGWVEGRNVVTTLLYADGDVTRLAPLAAQMVAGRPEVIVAPLAGAALTLQRMTRAIPIVMTANDPVAVGLVNSLAHPGGNITGISETVGYDVQGKRLEIPKEWIPGLSRIAVIYNPSEPGGALGLENIERNAARLGLRLEPLEVRSRGEVESRLAESARRRPDAMACPMTNRPGNAPAT